VGPWVPNPSRSRAASAQSLPDMISSSELGSGVLGGVALGRVVSGAVVSGGVVSGAEASGGGVLGSVLSASIVTCDLMPFSSDDTAGFSVELVSCTSWQWLSAVRLFVVGVRNRLKRGVAALRFFDDDGEAVREFEFVAERFGGIVVDMLVVDMLVAETKNERLCNFEVKDKMLLAKSFAPYLRG
jgi:hypothetical protein